MIKGQFDGRIPSGYQETSKGRRLAPMMCWSEAAFQRALRIPEYLAAPTAVQRMLRTFADG